jgi:hypothetical protein
LWWQFTATSPCVNFGKQLALHRTEDRGHHQVAVRAREALGPVDGEHVVVEVLGALGEVREVHVGQVVNVPTHVLLREFDEVRADAVADAARATVQHDPDALRLVEADLDEVVAAAERAEVLGGRPAVEPRVLRDQLLARRRRRPPRPTREWGRLWW